MTQPIHSGAAPTRTPFRTLPQHSMRTHRIRFAALLGLATALSSAPTAQAQTVRPTPEQASALLQARPELVQQLRQRMMSSGMSPEQVRARLKAEGYPENLLDAYMTGTGGGGGNVKASDAISAMKALGIVDSTDVADLEALAQTRLSTPRPRPILDPAAAKKDITLSDSSAVLFGLSMFQEATSRFNPNLDGPVDAGYKVGPGDELVLILTGDVELAHTLEVTRNGFVVIPQVGQISVANLTMAQLDDLLYARLGRVYSGVQRGAGATTKFSITVSRLRSNQVFVVGDVTAPGAYRISSAGTAMSALYAAGGPTARGSLRRVEVRRGGKVTATLDVYDYLLKGDASQDVRLQQGDVIFVPVHGPRVRVDGEVTRPATYEMKSGEQLADVLRAAGGLRATAASQKILVERVVPNASRTGLGANRTSLTVSLASDGAAPALPVADGDVVRVARIDDRVRNRIAVNGHVYTPGAQGFTAGLTLEQALKRAGGLKPDAYLGRVLVSRLNADSTRTQLRAMLRDTTGATIEPFVLQPDDDITTFSRTDFRPERYVAIAGAVKKGGRFPYQEGMTLRDLALLAGGLTDLADLTQAEIARRPDTASVNTLSETVRIPLDSGFLFADGTLSTNAREYVLKPFDNVLIFADPERRAPAVVKIAGEVRYPGSYTLRNRSERLSELLARAGGVTNQGDATAAYFSRKVDDTKQVEKLVQSAGEVRDEKTGQVKVTSSDAARLESEGASARIRVGVDLPKALAQADARDNLFLIDGDSIYVPPKQQTVTVRGEVNLPTALVASGKGLGAYIKAGGGATALGNARNAYVIQPNGKIESRSHLLWFITLDPEPKPGATVVVPAKSDRTSSGSIIQTMAVIVQSLTALATAVVLLK
jgi:protein involved in polysaccharide export with SLBB domain